MNEILTKGHGYPALVGHGLTLIAGQVDPVLTYVVAVLLYQGAD
jgi:hypothetical protein